MDSGVTEIDLAQFTGGDPTTYTRFVHEALRQASDLFEVATGLTEMPLDGLDLRMAQRAVLAMAEALYEGQETRNYRFSPFRSETIGSYTYMMADGNIRAGIPTGIAWFDLAVSRLASGDSRAAITTSSARAFDRPGDFAVIEGQGPFLIGPADRHIGHGYSGLR